MLFFSAHLTILTSFYQIPFLVIVQPHMLKDKGSVRLRKLLINGVPDASNNTEQVVLVENLAWAIRELTPKSGSGGDEGKNDQSGTSGQPQTNNGRDNSVKLCDPSIECIYIQNDQYFDSDRPVSKADTTNFKAILKGMRSITQRAESFVLSMLDPPERAFPVFAVSDVPFWCLRDFGSNLMKKANEQRCANACSDTIETHPTHKRSLKTLGTAIDAYMKRNGFWQKGKQERGELMLLLYSKIDDQFDLVTLHCKKSGRQY
jgi:hypothetical protein